MRPLDDLRADCDRCAGLCCVAPAFAASADFALDKPAGRPCPNLQPDFRCGIHADLRGRGFAGCTVFDCFGSGQQVVQVTFGGRDWRREPAIATSMFTAFTVMRQLNELRWYLTEALTTPAADSLRTEVRIALAETERLAGLGPDDLADLDVDAHRGEVNVLLLAVSDLVRAGAPRGGTDRRRPARRRGSARPAGQDRGADRAGQIQRETDPVTRGRPDADRLDPRAGSHHRCQVAPVAQVRPVGSDPADLRGANLRGADLVGRDLRDTDLRGASLRGACLIGADLRGADLRSADLIGADLRATDLRDADLTGSLFLTQFQVNAATGDADTRLPPALHRPTHWSTGTEPSPTP